MLDSLKALFTRQNETSEDRAKDVEVATAALLIATLRADFEVHESENEELIRNLESHLGLNERQAKELMELASVEVDNSVSLFDFTRVLNEGLEYAEKLQAIEAMWRIAMADSVLERHEEYLIRKVAGLLHIEHTDFIAAKLRARNG